MTGREARPYLQVQDDDAVASFLCLDRIVIDARLCVVPFRQRFAVIGVYLAESSGTDGVIYMRLVGATEIDIQVVDAIQRIERYQRVIVMQRVVMERSGVLLFITRGPYMRQGLVDRGAYNQGVTEDMGLMNGEVQHNGTVATILVRHRVGVFTRYVERVDMGGIPAVFLFPRVLPFVRQLAVGHNLALRRDDDTLAQLQTQFDDTVATVQRR